MKSRVELLQKFLQELPQLPDTDSSDSDYEPDEYESSASETDEDSEGEPETDLTHIDLKNIVGRWSAPVIPMEKPGK